MRLNFRILLLISAVLNAARSGAYSSAKEKEMEVDLLEGIAYPTDERYQYIDDGLDGFPALGFRPGSEIKWHYRQYLPEKLPAEFTLVATFKSMSTSSSYLFAVLNPFETVVQFGIRLSEGPGQNQNISLVYTNSDQHTHSEEIAKFTVPPLTKRWSKIIFRVSTTDVTLYLNCHEMSRQRITRIPQELVFDTASILYIAQAGPNIQEKYNVFPRYYVEMGQKAQKGWTIELAVNGRWRECLLSDGRLYKSLQSKDAHLNSSNHPARISAGKNVVLLILANLTVEPKDLIYNPD